MTRTALLFAALVAVAGTGLLMGAFEEPTRPALDPPTARAEALELVVWDGGKLARWELRVEVDGQSAPDCWDAAFGHLFAFADGDGSGALDRKEAARLPSAFGLRQVLWGGFVTGPGAGPVWDDLDRNGDGTVSRAELIDYYRRSGLGNVLVGAGKPPATAALTDALLKQLDADGDGTVDEKEWLGAADRLAKLDLNDDELVTPGELVPRATYPGATGAHLLTAPAEQVKPSAVADSLPLLVLPLSTVDPLWAAALVHKLDANTNGFLDANEAGLPPAVLARLDTNKDGQLSADELIRWRRLPADVRWVVRLGQRPAARAEIESRSAEGQKAGERLDASFGSLRFALRADAGQLPGKWDEGRKRLTAQFAEADPGRKGAVALADANKLNLAELRAAISSGDRNGDDKLDEKELESWLRVRDRIVKSHVLLTVLDHGAGLFESLDANHDGALSVRELRGAWTRLRDAGCVRDGRFDRARVPRQFGLTVSAGLPASPLGRPKAVGPAWFRAMDRNGDSDVSRKEFTGRPEVFDKLDSDKDGLISAEEAEKAAAIGAPKK
ncbi:EF-hand domain-containing protein [Frigoriglobus tundricola]|uniref:EF-hand domain-containing protein n=1 Tax=Frigoriglobus tundricola TaxID=2774151 RepID=A0A6M5YIC5_9BACT|nr:EF-hand domain-containing protein [Frigoriglobus tundricola]QJW93738.1 hypothetical protein FTUN_1249 [Frigoriglobus tundricola]